MTHSPEPWLFNPSTGYIRTETPRPNFPHGQVIAKVMSGPGKRAAENAALIIAAPDLLAILRDLTTVWDAYDADGPVPLDQIIERARLILARVEGGAA